VECTEGKKSDKNHARQPLKILKLELTKVGRKAFLLRICCKNEDGLIVQLSRALESLQLNIIYCNLSTADDHTVFAEVEEWNAMEENDIKEAIVEAAV
ncbi:hypothetical protein KI387_019383, partial [Taxus chinensis]